jgi:hypothetical protein
MLLVLNFVAWSGGSSLRRTSCGCRRSELASLPDEPLFVEHRGFVHPVEINPFSFLTVCNSLHLRPGIVAFVCVNSFAGFTTAGQWSGRTRIQEAINRYSHLCSLQFPNSLLIILSDLLKGLNCAFSLRLFTFTYVAYVGCLKVLSSQVDRIKCGLIL